MSSFIQLSLDQLINQLIQPTTESRYLHVQIGRGSGHWRNACRWLSSLHQSLVQSKLRCRGSWNWSWTQNSHYNKQKNTQRRRGKLLLLLLLAPAATDLQPKPIITKQHIKTNSFYLNHHYVTTKIQLAYDYKLNIEDDQHKISCLCGAPTCKKFMN